MTQTELPWLFYGRRIRPYALAVMYSTFVISWSLLVSRDGPGVALDRTLAGQIDGAIGMVAVLMLLAGFWFKRDRWMMFGLLLTSGVWFARAVFIALDQGPSQSVFLSLGWVIASVGAFFLEYLTGDDAQRRRRV